uniref:Uncharacterized protein n=1 Tax=Arundo donax TaxID=35708 RepID=A0A0A9HAG8_ARUDO
MKVGCETKRREDKMTMPP